MKCITEKKPGLCFWAYRKMLPTLGWVYSAYFASQTVACLTLVHGHHPLMDNTLYIITIVGDILVPIMLKKVYHRRVLLTPEYLSTHERIQNRMESLKTYPPFVEYYDLVQKENRPLMMCELEYLENMYIAELENRTHVRKSS